jgi:hypothetical protein
MTHLRLLILALAALSATAQTSNTAYVIGAIRWDAWHGDRSKVGQAVERSLNPTKWHARLPFFAQELPDGRVLIDGASQSVMDQEIQYARAARLDYWAFLLYGENDAMSLALKNYLTSTHKQGLRFCVIVESKRWKTREVATRIAELLASPDYQKVLGGRPLLYVLADSEQPNLALDRLPNPYVVIQNWSPTRANALKVQLHADAISAYAYQRDGQNAPYSQLARETERFWDDCRATSSQVVPIVMTGWDRRPRVEHPVFWETWQQPNAGIDKFYRAPTPAELTRHIEQAVKWVKTHPDSAPSKAILIYAWNENDEGGWLVPTRGDGESRLQAVSTALRSLY